ncbi:MAG: hypothetical protein QF915_00595 [Candidatus Woesearchaeota archaeon]|jgi:hypothetical protein|nr:hypothetical protein [Candidatus Woesearchaeota archaeon]MDP7457640.1 hypothetical protein [Candidatus Woesearchaeota archaeon]
MEFNTLYDLNMKRPPSKLEEVVEVLELVPNEKTQLAKEEEKEIQEAIDQEREEVSVLEEEKKKKPEDLNVKIPAPVYYDYMSPSKKKQLAASYTFVPSNVQIFRVPATVLGYNVLGCAFLGTNVVYIRDNLHGEAFEEVKRHEVNHILHPWMTESEIRRKTKNELPFDANFH